MEKSLTCRLGHPENNCLFRQLVMEISHCHMLHCMRPSREETETMRLSVNRKTDKESVVHKHIRILVILQKGNAAAVGGSQNVSRGSYVKQASHRMTKTTGSHLCIECKDIHLRDEKH